MKVILLLGTVRKGRQSHSAGLYVLKSLQARGVDAELVDFVKMPLPIFGMEDVSGGAAVKNMEIISKKLTQADAIILVTPEYHGSFSGVLKNALDHFWEEFQRKPVGIVAASAGRMGGINASTQLQHVILSMGAYPLPLKFLVPDIQNAFTTGNEPIHEHTAKAAERFLDEFLWFAEALYVRKVKKEIA